jgi:hypothetical protein
MRGVEKEIREDGTREERDRATRRADEVRRRWNRFERSSEERGVLYEKGSVDNGLILRTIDF